MIFVDSNVLLDVIVGDGPHVDWSSRMLARYRAVRRGINAVVRAETASRFGSSEEQSGYLERLDLESMPLTDAAAFRAGLAFRIYRRNGGERTAILADFLIGGHAAALGAALMTRDRGRFVGYFPELTLITPETHP